MQEEHGHGHWYRSQDQGTRTRALTRSTLILPVSDTLSRSSSAQEYKPLCVKTSSNNWHKQVRYLTTLFYMHAEADEWRGVFIFQLTKFTDGNKPVKSA